jgi:broad specificity phosphatase PhoE
MTDGVGPRRVFLIRHGLGEQTEGRCVGHTDVPLSAAGRAQCERLAAVWSPPGGSRLWCSDLTRAAESAAILHAAWRSRVTAVQVDSGLRECSFGEWDGRTWAEIEALDGSRLEEWMRDWKVVAPPGGETMQALSARAVRVLSQIVRSEVMSHVVVAHAGVLRAMLCHVSGAPAEEAFAWSMPHAHVSAVTLRGSIAQPGRVEGTVEWLHAFPAPAA